MPVKWKSTDKHVYGAIYREHYKDLRTFATCTAPDGNPQLSITTPYVMTEWGFKGADEPIIRIESHKKNVKQKDYDNEYFLAVVINEE